MGKYEDFDLDLTKIKQNEKNNFTVNVTTTTTSPICSWGLESLINTGDSCMTKKCKTLDCPSTDCSPGDMTTACNGRMDNALRC